MEKAMLKNMILKGWFACMLLVFSTCSQAQDQSTISRKKGNTANAGNQSKTCSAGSKDYLDFYRYQQNYIPSLNHGVKTIKLGLHIWNDKQGNGTFQDTPETRENFDQILAWINGWHENVSIPSDPVPGAATITDTRFRFVIDDVYYYKDSALNMSSNIPNLNAYVEKNHPERLDALLIHFTSHDGIGAGHSSGTSFQNDHDICAIVTEMQPPPKNGIYSIAQHLFHELAHSFGLHHTYNSEACTSSNIDFLSDVFDITAEKTCTNSCQICYHVNSCDNAFDSPTDFCTNNIMTGKGSTAYWTSPLQAGRMHRSTCLYSVRQYAWGYDATPHVIRHDETWDFSYKSYRDIVVKSGNTLTISCELQMIPEARIIVEPGAKLVIDGGKITIAKYAEPGQWKGIEVWNKPKKNKPNLQGEVSVINKGTIENMAQDGLLMVYKTAFKKEKSKIVPVPVSE